MKKYSFILALLYFANYGFSQFCEVPLNGPFTIDDNYLQLVSGSEYIHHTDELLINLPQTIIQHTEVWDFLSEEEVVVSQYFENQPGAEIAFGVAPCSTQSLLGHSARGKVQSVELVHTYQSCTELLDTIFSAMSDVLDAPADSLRMKFGFLLNMKDMTLEYYKFRYYSIDYWDNPVVLSGAVLIPRMSTCQGSLPITLYTHGTLHDKDHAPSRMGSGGNKEYVLGLMFGGKGFVTVMPDYIGLGDHVGIQYFVDAKTEASSSLDLIRAARSVQSKLNFSTNSEVFVTGYSQGGHSAMATAKVVYDQGLSNEFNIRALAPGSGPFDPSDLAFDYLLRPEFDHVEYALLAMESANAVFPFYNHINEYIIPPYDQFHYDSLLTASGHNDWARPSLSQNLYAMATNLEEYFIPAQIQSLRDDAQNQTGSAYDYLEQNDNYDWANPYPTKFYYTSEDNEVDPNCTHKAYLFQNGATRSDMDKIDLCSMFPPFTLNLPAGPETFNLFCDPPSAHINTAFPAMFMASAWFESVASGVCFHQNPACSVNSSMSVSPSESQVNTASTTKLITLFPNPASDIMQLQANLEQPTSVQLTVLGLNGQQVWGKYLHTEDGIINVPIPVLDFPVGMYIIQLATEQQIFYKKFQVGR